MKIFKTIKAWLKRTDDELKIEDYYFAKLGDSVSIDKIKEVLKKYN